jgi:hypothetical protein
MSKLNKHRKRDSGTEVHPALLADNGESGTGRPKHEEVRAGNAQRAGRRQFTRRTNFRYGWEVVFLAIAFLHILPIACLAAFASRFSKQLGTFACLPGGEFILPGTANVWARHLFFTLTIAFGRNSSWSYTHVRIVDLIWDIGVGRGGQIILVWVAYRVFHESITAIMEREPVAYGAYSTIAFETGSSHSVFTILRTFFDKKLRLSLRAVRLYVLMVLATIYIICMPSLFSASTGYAAIYAPSILIPQPHGGNVSCELGGCELETCGGPGSPNIQGLGLRPGWGLVMDNWRLYCNSEMCWTSHNTSIFMDVIAKDEIHQGSGIIDYYNVYKPRYEAAANDPRCRQLNDSNSFVNCPPLEFPSQINLTFGTGPYSKQIVNLSAPMLNIQTWGVNKTGGGPGYWLCDKIILNSESLNTGTNVTTLCTASTSYQWGFSFIILIIICVLNFTFSIIMYGLWIEARMHKPVSSNGHAGSDDGDESGAIPQTDTPSLLGDVMLIASSAERQYGEEVTGWSSAKLRERVWKGRNGLHARLNEG